MKHLFTLLLCSLVFAAYSQGITWEDQGLADEGVVTSGSTFSDQANQTTVTLTWNTVTNGGSFLPCCGDDFVTYEAEAQGGEAGHIGLGFNNDSEDNADKICVTLSFNPPVTGLTFTLLDVDEADDDDGNTNNQWDDCVEVFYNGTNNAKDFGSLLGPCVYKDSESFMDGWEGETFGSSDCGDDGTDNLSTDSNLGFDFGPDEISSVTIKYFSGNDLMVVNNPDVQLIGIGDLSFNFTLPVDLVSFDVQKFTPSINMVKWVTTNEVNNDYFDVERSYDGREFVSIGKVSGKGNSPRIHEYEIKDYKPTTGLNYYRLKQVDVSGDYKYSEIISIENGIDINVPGFRVWPNPVQDGVLQVSIDPSLEPQVQIFDALSRLVKTALISAGQDKVDVSDLQPGLYYLQVKNSTQSVASFVIADN